MTEITVDNGAVTLKAEARSIGVRKNKQGSNVIHIKSLTANVGKEAGVKSFLSEDDLVKNTLMALSDDAIIELTISLMTYASDVLEAELSILSK